MGETAEFYRDLKEHKKRQKLEHPPQRRCWDWMVVSGNCHYAKNRSSFKTYRPIAGMKEGVIGIGTVELEVRRSPRKGSGTGILVLNNVLHMPNAHCNGFNMSSSVTATTGVSFTTDLVQAYNIGNGKKLWHAKDFCGLNRLVISGNPQGESPLSELRGSPLSLSVHLSDEESKSLFGDEQPEQEKLETHEGRCWDWMVVGGDCHYARDRSAFKTYCQVSATAAGMAVDGIGTVELEVERSPEEDLGTKTLVLEDVLHIPSAKCNGFNSALFGISSDGAQSWGKGRVRGFAADMREPVWYATEFSGLNRLVIAGNPQGDSPLADVEGPKMLSLYMSEEEYDSLFGA